MAPVPARGRPNLSAGPLLTIFMSHCDASTISENCETLANSSSSSTFLSCFSYFLNIFKNCPPSNSPGFCPASRRFSTKRVFAMSKTSGSMAFRRVFTSSRFPDRKRFKTTFSGSLLFLMRAFKVGLSLNSKTSFHLSFAASSRSISDSERSALRPFHRAAPISVDLAFRDAFQIPFWNS